MNIFIQNYLLPLDKRLSGAEAIGICCPYDSYDDDDSYDL